MQETQYQQDIVDMALFNLEQSIRRLEEKKQKQMQPIDNTKFTPRAGEYLCQKPKQLSQKPVRRKMSMPMSCHRPPTPRPTRQMVVARSNTL